MANIIIVYYTWSGNTGHLASLIKQETGGRLFELELLEPYPAKYGVCVKQAKKEINAGVMPKLKAVPENLVDYDTVIVGSPIWWYTTAAAVKTWSRISGSGCRDANWLLVKSLNFFLFYPEKLLSLSKIFGFFSMQGQPLLRMRVQCFYNINCRFP